MSRGNGITRARRRLSKTLAVTSVVLLALVGGLWFSQSAPAATVGATAGFTHTQTVTRDHLVDGKDEVVDTRKVTVNVDTTRDLRDRQTINVTWSGAHPTGAVVYDNNSQYAASQEYPMVILECRGVDSTRVPATQQISPETCYTQTPDTRYQPRSQGFFPAWRVDRYAAVADRALVVDAPHPIPPACQELDTDAERWVPFVGANGAVYSGGGLGCAGLAPEQSIVQTPLAPPNATFGTTDVAGNGSARFVVNTEDTNATLGCSVSVKCAIVAIPIMGISCDAQGTARLPGGPPLPAADVPTDPAAAFATCSQKGASEPGAAGTQGPGASVQLPVTGQLWWAASNWRNRITVPLTFAQSASVCGIISSRPPINFYGSESLLPATQQWAPTFCLNPSLYPINHVQASEVQAKNLLQTGLANGTYIGVKAAFQGMPAQSPFINPVVQAPTGISGFAIAYIMDDGQKREYKSLRLNARLLAKLLTMSYPTYPDVKHDWASYTVKVGSKMETPYFAQASNPLDMAVDPEFLALNPGMKLPQISQLESTATLYAMSSDSDVMTALTSYINSDPDARAWLDGRPDPWGMVVNPNYRGIALPLSSWPQLDTYYNGLGNPCLSDNHSPILPLVAAPVSDPSVIPFNVQFGIANSQVACNVPNGLPDTAANRSVGALGREETGSRFVLGLVSLADARRYQLDTAALQTQKAPGADDFTDLSDRSFVQPTTGALRAAALMLTPDESQKTWIVPYDRMRTDPAGKNAYPGIMLLSTDVPTKYLDADDANRYARFLNYVAGPGQTAGLANGDLAPGYLPITAANGLLRLANYTRASAVAVANQKGVVPNLDGSVDPVPGGGGGSPSSASQPSDSGQSDASSDAAPTPPPATAAPQVSSSAPNTIEARPAGSTAGISTGVLGFALPALFILALLTGLASAYVSGVGRR
ncbi:hypothetical protein ACSMXN_03795 [Jatrophihabitans sp. DSM 45814]